MSWDLLLRLHGMPGYMSLPWLVGGDFNEVCFDTENKGGNLRPLHQTLAFRDTLDTCSLQDLHGSGDFFTWVNRRPEDELIFERLDRYVGTFEWRILYPTARAQSLEYYHSDHRPILLELGGTATQIFPRNSKFRFETHWATEEDCADVTDSVAFTTNQTKKDTLNSLQTHDTWQDSVFDIQRLEKEVESLASKEEIYWKQRSRARWLAYGNKNSKYFHKCRAKNLITRLVSSHSDWCTDKGSMAEFILDYFSNLFMSTNPSDQEIGKEVSLAVLEALNGGRQFADLKETIVTLIPKSKNPMTMKDFRPISLCNVCYKIASRALTNRLRPIMKNTVDEFQSAFVPSRLITDNIILGFEALHWIRSRKKGKKGYAALKLDMSKAYDRFEWSFLEQIMIKLLCSSMGGKNDSLIFFKATVEECDGIRQCLLLYEKASGQLISFEKSSLSFSPNTAEAITQSIKHRLSISITQGHEIYLGLPTFSLRTKKIKFRYLIERVVTRLQGWGHKTFSASGKETLIKSILQSIPTYAMSCFHIPKAICNAIEKECANFWWGMQDGKRNMHWKTWQTLCVPKCMGGLGFRQLESFNKALLAKQLWRIVGAPESVVARVLKARYFKHQDIMQASLGSNPSFIWRSLLWSRPLLQE
ncbi:uncharacterized protein LOC142519715 [Primulina tabacum]|uniref:uncharacterized protein LOC142519715 n=1 Tax=Primulina tabacum TaxID=48773 RepID=UPI003F5A03CD